MWASAQSRKTQRFGPTMMFAGFKSECPSESGICVATRRSRASLRVARRSASSWQVRIGGGIFVCCSINLSTVSKNGSTCSSSAGARKSLQFASRRTFVMPRDSNWRSARVVAAVWHAVEFCVSHSVTPSALDMSQARHSGFVARTFGT